MKLLKLYIENFGKLSKLELSFNDSLNIINQKNGWGKTTLANFIKAMFYGLVGNSRTDIDKNERTKFKPWQGGNYGGYLEFEVNAKQYRVTRFFNETESKDSFELMNLKTNKFSTDYSNKLGEELFNLDVEGFERSTYMNNKSLEMKDKTGIAKRLTNLLENTNETNNLNTALNLLDKKRQELKNKQNNGAIPETEKQIFNLSRQLEMLQANANELENKKILANDLKNEISLLEQKLSEIKNQTEYAQKEKEIQILLDSHEKLQNKINLAKEQLQLLNEFFTNKLPSEQELNELESEILTVNKIDGILEQKAFESNLSTQHDKLKEFFDNKLHYAQNVDDYLKKQERLIVLNEQLNNAMPTSYESGQKQRSIASKLGLTWFSVLALMLGAGLVIAGELFIKTMLALGIVLLVLGVGLLVAGIVEIFRNYFKSKHAVNFKFHAVNENSVQILRQLQSEKEAMESEIINFLNVFYHDNEYDNYYTALRNLQKLYDKFLILQEQNKQWNVQFMNLKEQRQTSVENIELMIRSIKLNESNNYNEILQAVKTKVGEYHSVSKFLKNLQTELQEFEQKNNIVLSKSNEFEVNTSYDELKSLEKQLSLTLESLKEQKTLLDSKITQLSLECEVIPDKVSEKENLENSLKLLEQKFEIIKLTDKFLNQAQENITGTYLGSMKESFIKHVNLLTNEDLGKFTITSDLKLKVEQFGINYDSDYFSKGYKDILEFAMRLALIEVLFESDVPFIILDDPFVNLDNEKIALATSLVKEVSKKYQVIYFLCHNSRAVNK